jgi:hypothetical protein
VSAQATSVTGARSLAGEMTRGIFVLGVVGSSVGYSIGALTLATRVLGR